MNDFRNNGENKSYVSAPIDINPESTYLLWILALFSALAAISVDLFFPAMSVIKTDFGVSADLVQGSIYGFFIGLGFAQLIWGNLSDYIGRRPVMLLGTILYCVSVIGCLFSTDIYLFIFFRFMQGMSAAVGIIMARAIVRDIYGPDKSAKALATMFLMFSIMPIILPAVGGYISTHFHWHVVLYLMLGVGILTIGVSYLFLMETAPLQTSNTRGHDKNILHDYWDVARNLVFVKNALMNMFVFSVLLTFISNCSVLLDKYYLLSPSGIGYFLMSFGACLMIGVVLIRFFLVSKMGVRPTIRLAGIGLVTGSFVLMSLVLMDYRTLYIAIFPTLLVIGGSIGILLTLCAGEAIKPFSAKAGTASSLYGFVQHSGASLIGFIISTSVGGQIHSMTVGLFLLASTALLIRFLITGDDG